MLSQYDFLNKFLDMQQASLDAVGEVALGLRDGISELTLADDLDRRLSGYRLPLSKWYPTLVCMGIYSGQPLTRRNHLPNVDVNLKKNDIVILDVTPQHETVWANWTVTVAHGDAPFFTRLVADSFAVTLRTAAYAAKSARTAGDIHRHCSKLAADMELVNIDPRHDAGHNIFQVPAWQSVDRTPEDDRLFIDSGRYKDTALTGLISVEPQLARTNPADGLTYGCKQQFILPYLSIALTGWSRKLIEMQLNFFRRVGFAADGVDIYPPDFEGL